MKRHATYARITDAVGRTLLRRKKQRAIHPQGVIERIVDVLRGREQKLVRAGDDLPLLLISYPRGKREIALDLELVYSHTLSSLPEAVRSPYLPMLASLPAVVVVLLRASNPCGCLGHHHPRGTESRLTRRLAADLGSEAGEIDLAYESIRRWSPQPLSAMSAGVDARQIAPLHFQAAMLAVLLHELEHLAFPEHTEKEVRLASNRLYSEVMEHLVLSEYGVGYGM